MQTNGLPDLFLPKYQRTLKRSLVDAVVVKWQPAEAEHAPQAWQERMRAMFPFHFWLPFSDPHVEMHEWANSLKSGQAADPFIAIWSRGRGKSTNAEALTADLGARQVRTYAMYVSGTQDQADKHVATIARMLESEQVARYYPAVGNPRISKHGGRTWNRQILRADNGFTVEAVGLNKAIRGQKIDWARPDLIVMDDIDERHDTQRTINRKLEIITESILPAGASHVAVLFVQNIIHAESIASMLARLPSEPGSAQFLINRQVSGPYPAVDGLEYERIKDGDTYRWRITAGRSLWHGFGIDNCESELALIGPDSFESEMQHNIEADNPHALLSKEDFDLSRVSPLPMESYSLIGIGVDPPGGVTECGIVVVGSMKKGQDWHGYTLADYSQPEGVKTEKWATSVLQAAYDFGTDVILAEKNFGGDMVRAAIANAILYDEFGEVLLTGRDVRIILVNASRGKRVRAEPVALAFQQGRAHHVGHFPKLEKEWRQWIPGDASPNRLDAEVWAMLYLLLKGKRLQAW